MGFGPPSDFVDDDGAPWGKIAVYGSAGCMVVVLVGSLLMTWGTCAATEGCCDALESANRKLIEPAQLFLDAVGTGHLDDAYAMTTEAYQARVDREAFDTLMSGSDGLFRGGKARFVFARGSVNQRSGQMVTVQITDVGTATVKGTATFVYRRRPDGKLAIDDVTVGSPERDLAGGSARRISREFLTALGRGEIEEAFSLQHSTYQASTDLVQFRALADAQRELLERNTLTITDVRALQGRAVVSGELLDDAQTVVATVEVKLALDRPRAWRVTSWTIANSGGSDEPGLVLEVDDAGVDATPSKPDVGE